MIKKGNKVEIIKNIKINNIKNIKKEIKCNNYIVIIETLFKK